MAGAKRLELLPINSFGDYHATNYTKPLYGDSEGTRTPDLQRDRLAFYATELRSHIMLRASKESWRVSDQKP